jgi:hypothetical protein
MHLASEKGLVELVKALVESGADVHAKDFQGYGRLFGSGSAYIVPRSLATLTAHDCGGCLSALQPNGAGCSASERPHGDGEGAGSGGRAPCQRARQGLARVRSAAASWARHLAFELGCAMRAHAGCAGGRHCTMPQKTATRRR